MPSDAARALACSHATRVSGLCCWAKSMSSASVYTLAASIGYFVSGCAASSRSRLCSALECHTLSGALGALCASTALQPRDPKTANAAKAALFAMRSPYTTAETPLQLKAGQTAPLEPVKDGTANRLKIMVAPYNAILPRPFGRRRQNEVPLRIILSQERLGTH